MTDNLIVFTVLMAELLVVAAILIGATAFLLERVPL